MNAKRIFKILTLLERPVLILAGAAALTAALFNINFTLLESKLYDFRMRKGLQATASPDIVLVGIDDATIKALDEFVPLPLNIHVRFLEELEKLSPKAVGYLADMGGASDLNPDLLRQGWGARFNDAARRLESRSIPLLIGTKFAVTGEVLPPPPLSSLPHAIAVIHKDGNVFAEDKVTRRALTYLHDRPVFHVELAQRLGLFPQEKLPRGSYYVPEVDGHYFFFRYHGNTVVSPDHPRVDLPYKYVSFVDVLNGAVPRDQIEGKILLIGTLTQEDSSDYAWTPYSKTPFANPKLLIHANILDSLIKNDGIAQTEAWFNWFTTMSVTAFVLAWVVASTPLQGLFATLGMALIFMIFSQLMFQIKGVWVRESEPLIGIFLVYYLVVPYRLILEYKRRWDYQKKNELLMQVEELKTNFLSLVTHDLKTPVARIQGLAEVLLRKAADRLVDRDKETIQHIIQSTDELNHFISSILELTKIESDRLHLKLESKDVNILVERAVEGFKAQARVRGIRIQTNLEPLFPIKVDVSLITKVLNNLIDNALKYSENGLEVLVQTREIGDWVEISVSDKGIGLSAEEKKKLFTKFFRAKNDATTKIAGTGLGLYLTKYFIEAHNGRVEIESEKGKGSTFKILLPIDPLKNPVAAAVKPGLATRIKKTLKLVSDESEKEKTYV